MHDGVVDANATTRRVGQDDLPVGLVITEDVQRQWLVPAMKNGKAYQHEGQRRIKREGTKLPAVDEFYGVEGILNVHHRKDGPENLVLHCRTVGLNVNENRRFNVKLIGI